MGDPNGRIRFIYMLTAGSCGSVGVYPKVALINFYYNFLVYLRVNKNRCERCMSPRTGVKRGYAHKSVNADFGLGITIGILSLNGYGNTFNTGFISRLKIYDSCSETFPLRPS